MIHALRLVAGLLGCLLAVRSAAAPPALRVLTYNVHHCEGTDGKLDVERIAKVITGAKPDLVALQEIDVKAKRTGGVDQACQLAELTKMQVEFGATMPFQGGEYGNAVLSRWHIVESKTHALPRDEVGKSPEPRAVLACRIKPDNGLPELLFASTHLCHVSAAARARQAEKLNGVLAEKDGPPIILAGDFNAKSKSEAMRTLLDARWLDATEKISVIDYVLVRPRDGWRVVEVKSLDEPVASDHLPVLAVLEWSR